MPDLLFEIEDHIATITLNRPDRMNAISRPMLDELAERLVQCNHDQNVRVVLITGAGRGFCAGLDLQDATSGTGIGSSQSKKAAYRLFDLRNAPPTVLHNMDKPTICAINGGAAGYGMDLALGCDIRLMAEEAKMSAAFTKRGVVPESGGTWLLPRIVGWSVAAEIFFTGRKLDAKQCLDYGIVNEILPKEDLLDTARGIAAEIAANAPLAVQATKRMMRMAMSESFESNVDHVLLQLMPLFSSEDFQEGIQSFLEKRQAVFHGR
jgi:enoyl-CoA hydratase/carnithine racemase